MDHVSITLLIEEREEKLLPMHYLMWKYEYHMKKEYGGGSRSRKKNKQTKIISSCRFLIYALKGRRKKWESLGKSFVIALLLQFMSVLIFDVCVHFTLQG